MKYLRLRQENEDDTEYDVLVVFVRDYKYERVETAMKELWDKPKYISAQEWLNHKGLKVKDMIELNKIDVMYTN